MISKQEYDASHTTLIDGELGGCAVGEIGDPFSYVPEVWRWLIDELGVTSVLDVGCGMGYAAKWFVERGCLALGIEGSREVAARCVCPVALHDFTAGVPAPFLVGEWDLAWCSEFLEHIDEEYLPDVFYVLRKCRHVAVTAATPGQPGHHHVNCQPTAYWVEKFAEHGFGHMPGLSGHLRWVAAKHYPGSYFSRVGMLFQRRLG